MKKILLPLLLFTSAAIAKLPAKPVLFLDYDKLAQQSLEFIKLRNNNKSTDALLSKLRLICERITKEKDAAAVLYSVGLLFYIDPEYDVTDEVIKILNKVKE